MVSQAEWDESVCACAESEGHLEVLKWIRNNGCLCKGRFHKNNIQIKTYKHV
jgi:hypothetical protein